MDQDTRLLDAINELCLAGRGSLWILKDTVWEKAIENFNRKRKGISGH